MFKPFLRVLALLALLCLAPFAHADWADDVTLITRLMHAGDYAAAEKACSDSLARGPSGLLSGTGTLIIHHWRGRARLIQGHLAGAIEDGDAIIRAEGNLFPPDAGYGLRGVAKVLQGDVAGARAEFDALARIDRSGMSETLRTGGFHGERAIARILSGDVDGADADLAVALALDYGFLGGEAMSLNKQAWAEMRGALASLRANNRIGAVEAFRRARAVLTPGPGRYQGSEFVLAQLLIDKFSSARRLDPAPKGKDPAPPVKAVARSGGPTPVASKVVPGQQSHWGFVVEAAQGPGVLLPGVKRDSPAGAAGLQAGDVLLAIEGRAVNSVQEFRAIKNGFPFFTPLKLDIQRGQERLERTIALHGVTPVKLKPARVDFTIPGVAPPAPRAPDAVNVLDQVILDPATGKVAVIGHYDERYDTGPIPYLDLLKTALAYPKPQMNLEDDSDKQLSKIEDPPQDWPTKEFILTHPALEQDRQLLIQAWAAAGGLLPEELAALYNHVHFARKEPVPPAHIRVIQEKLLRNLGYAAAADAYRQVNLAAPDAPLKALQGLGRTAEAGAIQARAAGNAATARGLLTAAVYLAILDEIHAPPGEVFNFRHDLAQNRLTWQQVVTAVQGRLLPVRSAGDSRDVAKVALNTLMLSNRATRTLYPQLHHQETALVPIDLDPTSQLARICYEGDYSLKSMMVMPQLFRHIPEAMSFNDYHLRHKVLARLGVSRVVVHHWLEPDVVSMSVSPERRVISFGEARIRYRALADSVRDHPEAGTIFSDWTAVVTQHYEDYARLLPAFHKVREAAKIIALANWLIDGRVAVDLRDVPQEKWDAPRTVPGFWRSGLIHGAKGADGKGVDSFHIAYSGGVVFKRQNWTQVSAASPASETGASAHLALSAGLGQRAVQAARGGDLEAARHLADLSAQAMSGRLSSAELAKVKMAVPPPASAPVSPAAVQLQQTLLQHTRQHIAALRQNPAAPATAAEALNELDRVYAAVRDTPVAASDHLTKLQTRQTSPPAAAPAASVEPVAESVCGQRPPGDGALAHDRKADLAQRLAEARDRLQHIHEALRKLIALNAAERAEIDKLTADISARYEEAQDRAWDVVLDLLTGVSLDAFGAEQARRLKAIDDAIAGKTALKATPQNPIALRALNDEITLLQSARYRSEEAYAATAQWVDGLKMGKYAKDIDDWRREDDRERTRNGLALVAGLAVDHPWLEKWLGRKAFFAGDKLWQVAAMGRMSAYAAGFAYDILTQWAVWEPMTHRMYNELQYNVQAIERMRLRAGQAAREIGCLEAQLR